MIAYEIKCIDATSWKQPHNLCKKSRFALLKITLDDESQFVIVNQRAETTSVSNNCS